jgi:hypothetical protein
MLEALYATAAVLMLLGPLWLPVAFVFYAIWRERLTRKMTVAFVLAECVSVGLSCYALRILSEGA